MAYWSHKLQMGRKEEREEGEGVEGSKKPVNFSMRVCVSLNVNETDIVVVKKTKSDIMRTPHLVTR